VDVVDIVLGILLLAAAVQGLRLGALVLLLTFGGFCLGFVLGALLSLAVVGGAHSPTVRTVVTLSVTVGLALSLGLAGRVVGSWSNAALRRHHLGSVDAVLGVGVALVAVLLTAWLVASIISASRYQSLNAAVQRSDILRSVDQVLPPIPSFLAHVQALLGEQNFPPAFVALAPPTAGSVAVPTEAQARALADPAIFSTVKVVGVACGYRQEGSGFVVAPGLVATNAHVVAGEPATEILAGGVASGATVVAYDPEFDLALLHTGAHLGPPLALDPADVARGAEGAVLGYPEDGPLTVGPAGVTADLQAEGRDIYNDNLVTRDVYEIEADVRPGNSGGPLVSGNGQVIGMVFSRSTTQDGVGYALASPGVLSRVHQALGRTAAVSTGACVAS
jgi:S1-C subfamily serine protease